jgi:hypothetical protein
MILKDTEVAAALVAEVEREPRRFADAPAGPFRAEPHRHAFDGLAPGQFLRLRRWSGGRDG